LTKEVYTLGGMTAMNDAIGRTLNKAFQQNPEKVIICILTDGQENASKEYTIEQSKNMIERARSKGWEVAFLAANQDAFATAKAYGINPTLAATFSPTATGAQAAYQGLSVSTTAYRAGK
jgi:Mg-chelatase subunit ChlD